MTAQTPGPVDPWQVITDLAHALLDGDGTEGSLRAIDVLSRNGISLGTLDAGLKSWHGTVQEPQATPELATLRALHRVAARFAGTWAELMTSLPGDYGCEMNCAEANAAADLYHAFGLDSTAQAIVAAHAEYDDDEERAAHREDTP